MGELEFYLKTWISETEEFNLRKLKKRLCTFEDIENDASYGLISDSDPHTVEEFKKRVNQETMWCIDEDY